MSTCTRTRHPRGAPETRQIRIGKLVGSTFRRSAPEILPQFLAARAVVDFPAHTAGNAHAARKHTGIVAFPASWCCYVSTGPSSRGPSSRRPSSTGPSWWHPFPRGPSRQHPSRQHRLGRTISAEPLSTEPWCLRPSWRRDSNPQPADYKSAALPVELRQRSPKLASNHGGFQRPASPAHGSPQRPVSPAHGSFQRPASFLTAQQDRPGPRPTVGLVPRPAPGSLRLSPLPARPPRRGSRRRSDPAWS